MNLTLITTRFVSSRAFFALAVLTLGTASCSQAQNDNTKATAIKPTDVIAESSTRSSINQSSGTRNLVQNPSFENGTDSYAIPDGLAALDASTVKSGKSSLKLSNPDPASYRWVAQTIPIASGGKYQFSAQIKGENLVSLPNADVNRGASVFLEWSDASGKWLGGAYLEGKLGTFDWTRFEGVGDLPLNARKMIVGLYLRKGTTGTAYFDDLSVTSLTPPLRVFIASPNYRGLILKGDQSDWKALLSVHRAPEYGAPLSVRSQVLENGKVVSEKTVPVAPYKAGDDESVQVALSQPYANTNSPAVKSLAWKIDVIDNAKRVLASRQFAFRVLDALPDVSIAKGGTWIVKGKRFFPVGIYLGEESDSSDADLKRISEAGFNTVLNYAYGSGKDPVAFLDRAQKYGLKVIYSLKDFTTSSYLFPKESGKTPSQVIGEYVKKLKDHPALLGWYLNDEGGLERADDLRAMQKQVIALDDRAHPIVHVLLQYGSLDGYYDLTDVIGVDPYPVPFSPLDIVTTWSEEAVAATRGVKSALLVTQAHSFEVYPPVTPGSRYPTLLELRCMNLLGLCTKTNGLLSYAYMDLWMKDAKRDKTVRDEPKFRREWAKVSTVSREMRALLPALLNGKDVVLPSTNSRPSHLRSRALQNGATTTLIVANSDAKSAATLSFAASRFSALRQQSGNVMVQKKADQWVIQVPPHGSAILILN